MHCSQLNEYIQNQLAVDMYHKNYDEFAEKAKQCVTRSLERIYENDTSRIVDKHYLFFDQYDKDIHEAVLQNIKKKNSDSSSTDMQATQTDPFGVVETNRTE